MKRFLIFGALLITLTFVACGNSTATTQDNSVPSVSESAPIVSSSLDEDTASAEMNSKEETQQEYTIISVDELHSCFKTIEITQDNWQDYFEFTETKVMLKDTFGDETGEYWICSSIQPIKEKTIRVGDKPCGDPSVHVTFEFHVVYTDGILNRKIDESKVVDLLSSHPCREIVVLSGLSEDGKEWKNEIEEITLTRVKGIITEYIAPSSDKWNMDEEGNRFLAVPYKAFSENEYMICLFEDGAFVDTFYDAPRRNSFVDEWKIGREGVFFWCTSTVF